MKKTLFLLILLAGMSQAQTTVAPFLSSKVQLLDNSGSVCSGCFLDTFAAGTTTPLVTYSESTGTTPNANPIVLDSSGRATVYLTSASYKFRLRSALGAILWTQDQISWATPLSTFAGLIDTGDLTLQQSTAATSGANQSSNNFLLKGSVWNGSAAIDDIWNLRDVLGSGANGTSTLTLTHSGSSGATTFSIVPPVSFTGNVSAQAILSAKDLARTCDASFYSGADDGAKMTAAGADSNCTFISALNLITLTGASPVTIPNNKWVIMPCGLYVGTGTAFSVGSFAGIIGSGQNCTIISTNSGTANIIDIPSTTQWWGLRDFAIRSEVARTAGAGVGGHGGNGIMERVVVYPVFDGVWFDTASTAGQNMLRDVQFTNGTGSPSAGSGGTWHCGFRNGGVAAGLTVSGNTLDHVTAAMNTAFTDAGFCIQDGSDTIIITGNSQAVANIGGSDSVALHLELVNTGNPPTNIQIGPATFEGGLTKNGVVIDSGLNVKFSSVTVQTSLKGILVNSCVGCSFIGGTLHLNQQHGIHVVSAFSTNILGNHFSDNSQGTTNTFDDILIAANVGTFQIRGNAHADFSSTGKVCKWGIEVAAGTSNNYVIDDVNGGSCGTGSISDSGTGLRKRVGIVGDTFNFGGSALEQMGATSGFVTIQPPATAGTPTMTWSTVTGIIGSVGTGTTTTNGTLIAAGACQAQPSITIAGAATTDAATANINAALPATWQTGIRWFAEVQSGGACVPLLCNPTAGSITPAATAIRCTVIHTQ